MPPALRKVFSYMLSLIWFEPAGLLSRSLLSGWRNLPVKPDCNHKFYRYVHALLPVIGVGPGFLDTILTHNELTSFAMPENTCFEILLSRYQSTACENSGIKSEAGL